MILPIIGVQLGWESERTKNLKQIKSQLSEFYFNTEGNLDCCNKDAILRELGALSSKIERLMIDIDSMIDDSIKKDTESDKPCRVCDDANTETCGSCLDEMNEVLNVSI